MSLFEIRDFAFCDKCKLEKNDRTVQDARYTAVADRKLQAAYQGPINDQF